MLAPRLAELSKRYPELELELLTRDGIGDLVAEGVDLALRFGPPTRRVAGGAAAAEDPYPDGRFAQLSQAPRHPEGARRSRQPCLHSVPRSPDGAAISWEFHRKRKVIKVDVSGPFVMTDVGTMLEACVQGAGIAQVMEFGAMDYLYRNRLVELFPDWPDETFPLYVFHPSRPRVPARCGPYRFLQRNDDDVMPEDAPPDRLDRVALCA